MKYIEFIHANGQQIEAEMRSNHVRHDALEVMARVALLDQILGDVKLAA